MLTALSMPLAAGWEWFQFHWLLFFVCGLFGLFYFVAPLVILVQQRFEARPRMIRFDPRDFELPPEIDKLFTTSVADLSNLGFEVVDGLFLPSAVPNVQTALLLLVNRTDKDAAIVTAVYATSGSPSSAKSLYVEYSSRFNDGFEYNTNNTTHLPSFPARNKVKTLQLVEIADSAKLYRIHEAVMKSDGRSSSQKVLQLDREFGGDSVAFLQHGMQEEFESAAGYGYLSLTPNGEKYRPTIKGAFLVVWKELWPWKLIRKYQRSRRARSVLSKLAM